MALGPFRRRRSAAAEPHDDLAREGPKDLDREQRRLEAAVLDGEVPPIWYRQRMTALAAIEPVTDGPVTAVPEDGGDPLAD